jgi:hypothetical protein
VLLGQGNVSYSNSSNKSQQQVQEESGLKRKQSGDIFKQKRAIYLGKNKNIEEEDEIKEQDNKRSENDDSDDGNGKNGNKKDYDFREDDFLKSIVKIKTIKKIIQDSSNQKIKLVKKIYTYDDERVKMELVKKPVNVKKK